MNKLPDPDPDTAQLHAVNAAAYHLAEAARWRGIAETLLGHLTQHERDLAAARERIRSLEGALADLLDRAIPNTEANTGDEVDGIPV